jgi:16S rRNA (cytosine1402-N4)-methyltransferase
VARAIVEARPIADTTALAEVVRNAIPAPARRRPGDPSKRSFQAIRMEVNKELEVLQTALDEALDLLAPAGRVVVLSYHSGEDRMVKQKFVEASTGGCVCPPALPCVCGASATHKLLTRGARKPTEAEAQDNKRAASARLRAAEALPTGEKNS